MATLTNSEIHEVFKSVVADGMGHFTPKAAEFAYAIIAANDAKSAQIPEPAWLPLTQELLTAIEAGEYGGTSFWLAVKGYSAPVSGEYEWQQGRYPHGFNDDRGNRFSAGEVTHVMPYNPPSLPMD